MLSVDSKEATIPACLGPRATITPPSRRAPPGSWDTIFHVFGPQARFPYAAGRKYTPPDSPFTVYRHVMTSLGIDRAIVVQPNLHGSDNRVTVDAVFGARELLIGVVKADAGFDEACAAAMHLAGVRGVRFAFVREHGGTLDRALVEKVIACVRGLGWFLQFHMSADDLVELHGWLKQIPMPIAIDHFGRIRTSGGLHQRGFQALLDLQASYGAMVRISGADRISDLGAPYDDVIPFIQAAIRNGPDRVLWGTDWPHSGYFDAAKLPDDGVLFELLVRATDDADLEQILVHNPNRLARGHSLRGQG